MATPLLSLPLETRCQILGYLLTSPSKCITTLPPGPWLFSIIPWDLRQEITVESYSGDRSLDLSLLQVCKQLNQECKDILWGQNTVVYKPYEISRHNESVSKGRGPIAHARRVAMSVDMTAGSPDIWNVASALEMLVSWAQSGSLEEVTIIVVSERRKPFEERDPKVEREKAYKASLKRLLNVRSGKNPETIPQISDFEAPGELRKVFDEHLLTLREARLSLANLKRKMIVNTNFERLSNQEQRKYLQEASMDPNELMSELSVAFGGELWVDGIVCFRDGKQVKKAFQYCTLDDHSDLLEEDELDAVTTARDQMVLGKKETPGTSTAHDSTVASGPWGHLLQERASILDMIE